MDLRLSLMHVCVAGGVMCARNRSLVPVLNALGVHELEMRVAATRSKTLFLFFFTNTLRFATVACHASRILQRAHSMTLADCYLHYSLLQLNIK